MLLELSIKDFAIIDRLDVSFKRGMTVLTGETGAGKSIIIDAVGLLAGGRGSVDFIRHGANKSILQGVFSLPKSQQTTLALKALGIEVEDELIITRELQSSGRNVCRINGTLINLSGLKSVGQTLIDIHGQNEHQELMDQEKHIDMLDQFDLNVIKEVKSVYQKQYSEYAAAANKLKQLKNHEQEWNQRLDMLQFQVDEIATANLTENEEIDLEKRRDQLSNFQAISKGLTTALQALENDEGIGAIELTGQAMQEVQGITAYNSDYDSISQEAQDAYYALEDAGNQIRRAIDDLEWNDGELDQVEQRLEVIYQLKKKYGSTTSEILAYFDSIKTELENMQESTGSVTELSDQVDALYAKLLKSGKQLSSYRRQVAEKLQVAVEEQLSELYMNKARFEVRFNQLKFPTNKGFDDIEFYLQSNPGEDLKPLVKVASGGELSRIMLALKTIFAQNDGVTSIIFDEVDTGVSGRVAQAIADKIHQISEHSQVLCISHLPQVAAKADHQLFVAKSVKGNRTKTTIKNLDQQGRVEAIAQMLAGTDVTELSLEHAKELLTDKKDL